MIMIVIIIIIIHRPPGHQVCETKERIKRGCSTGPGAVGSILPGHTSSTLQAPAKHPSSTLQAPAKHPPSTLQAPAKHTPTLLPPPELIFSLLTLDFDLEAIWN